MRRPRRPTALTRTALTRPAHTQSALTRTAHTRTVLTRTAAALATLAAAAVTLPAAPVAEALTARAGAACEAPGNPDRFPIDTRIEPGPDTYRPGDAPLTWSLGHANRTASRCASLHPVLVLVDRTRRLRPEKIRLEYRDGDRWRPVGFEHTDRDENIGVIGKDTAGFTVGPGATVTVALRLAFAGDVDPDHVVADAALVQRRADDGDWVGESDQYEFDIVTGGDEDPPQGDTHGRADARGQDPAQPPGRDDRTRPDPEPPALAATGPHRVLAALAGTAALCVLTGTAALLLARRRRP
jgi:hypothetical protein